METQPDSAALVRAFRDGLARGGRPDPGEPEDTPRLGTALATALDEARRAWPTIPLAPEVFAGYLGEKVAAAASAPHEALAELRSADLYLACACLRGEPAAVAELEARFIGTLPVHLGRLHLPPASFDEVRQQLREHLLVGSGDGPPALAAYGGRGPLQAWFGVVATRRALRLFRGQGREVTLDYRSDDAELLGPARDPEIDFIRQRYRAEFQRAFSAAVAALSSRDRNVLRLSLLSGMSIDVIGRMYQVHRGTAARWIQNAREQLLTLTRKQLQQQLALSVHECESLIQVLQSQLDLTVERFFRSTTST